MECNMVYDLNNSKVFSVLEVHINHLGVGMENGVSWKSKHSFVFTILCVRWTTYIYLCNSLQMTLLCDTTKCISRVSIFKHRRHIIWQPNVNSTNFRTWRPSQNSTSFAKPHHWLHYTAEGIAAYKPPQVMVNWGPVYQHGLIPSRISNYMAS